LRQLSYCVEPGYLSRYSDWLHTGWSGFEYRLFMGIFLFTIASRPALGPIPPPIRRVPGVLSLG